MALERDGGSNRAFREFVKNEKAREEQKMARREFLQREFKKTIKQQPNMARTNNGVSKRILDKLSPAEKKAHNKREKELNKLQRRAETLLRQGQRAADKATKRKNKR